MGYRKCEKLYPVDGLMQNISWGKTGGILFPVNVINATPTTRY